MTDAERGPSSKHQFAEIFPAPCVARTNVVAVVIADVDLYPPLLEDDVEGIGTVPFADDDGVFG